MRGGCIVGKMGRREGGKEGGGARRVGIGDARENRRVTLSVLHVLDPVVYARPLILIHIAHAHRSHICRVEMGSGWTRKPL